MKYTKYFYLFVLLFILFSLYFIFRSTIVEGLGGRGGGRGGGIGNGMFIHKNINNAIDSSNAGFSKDGELKYYQRHFIDPAGNDGGLPYVQN